MNNCEIKKITPAEASNVIETRKPLGLFYCIDNGIYVGIDNRTGDAWTEDFRDLSAIKKWLKQ